MPLKPPTHRPPRLPALDGRPSAAARGYGASWRRLRRIVLAARPMCQACGREAAVDVDHADGNVRNLADENLVALCHSCHSRKTAAMDGAFGRPRVERRG